MIGKLIVATLLTAGMLLTGALNLGAQPTRSDQAQTAVATPACALKVQYRQPVCGLSA